MKNNIILFVQDKEKKMIQKEFFFELEEFYWNVRLLETNEIVIRRSFEFNDYLHQSDFKEYFVQVLNEHNLCGKVYISFKDFKKIFCKKDEYSMYLYKYY